MKFQRRKGWEWWEEISRRKLLKAFEKIFIIYLHWIFFFALIGVIHKESLGFKVGGGKRGGSVRWWLFANSWLLVGGNVFQPDFSTKLSYSDQPPFYGPTLVLKQASFHLIDPPFFDQPPFFWASSFKNLRRLLSPNQIYVFYKSYVRYLRSPSTFLIRSLRRAIFFSFFLPFLWHHRYTWNFTCTLWMV